MKREKRTINKNNTENKGEKEVCLIFLQVQYDTLSLKNVISPQGFYLNSVTSETMFGCL